MLNRIRKMREKKGFTLVELIVVIAIIAILTAVIVPLVGRYSAQATYTTLQDAAKTISTSADNVISDITMMGSVYNQRIITGTKTNNGSLTCAAYSDTSITSTSGDDEFVLVPMTDEASTSSLDTQMCTKLQESLQNALPRDAYFVVVVANNTVKSVLYTTDATLGATITGYHTEEAVKGASITANTDFTEAYQVGSTAVGVQGALIPATTAASS